MTPQRVAEIAARRRRQRGDQVRSLLGDPREARDPVRRVHRRRPAQRPRRRGEKAGRLVQLRRGLRHPGGDLAAGAGNVEREHDVDLAGDARIAPRLADAPAAERVLVDTGRLRRHAEHPGRHARARERSQREAEQHVHQASLALVGRAREATALGERRRGRAQRGGDIRVRGVEPIAER